MSNAYPDIEIDVKRPDEGAIRAWLDRRFGITGESKRGSALIYRLGDSGMECVVVDNAVKGGYTSVWFRSNQTPWEDDHACAVEAFSEFGLEVRCSASPWADGDAEEGGWIRMPDKGESRVNWRA